jgi:hypothetical protein
VFTEDNEASAKLFYVGVCLWRASTDMSISSSLTKMGSTEAWLGSIGIEVEHSSMVDIEAFWIGG